MIECPKCKREAMSRIKVLIDGKSPGITYAYDRYVHYWKDGRRKVKRTYCYVRAT